MQALFEFLAMVLGHLPFVSEAERSAVHNLLAKAEDEVRGAAGEADRVLSKLEPPPSGTVAAAGQVAQVAPVIDYEKLAAAIVKAHAEESTPAAVTPAEVVSPSESSVPAG